MTVKICICGNQYDNMGFKTVCPTCFDKTRKEKVSPQFLGMVCNQAIQLIKKDSTFDETKYKDLVRRLFKWNSDLQKELIK